MSYEKGKWCGMTEIKKKIKNNENVFLNKIQMFYNKQKCKWTKKLFLIQSLKKN